MKLMMNERIKHRLTGLVVIVSIAVIFLPAMMKKSNQRFEESLNVSLKLPAKPVLPKVAIPNEQAMFQSVKVAHVDIQAVTPTPHPSAIAKAEPLSTTVAHQVRAVAAVTKPIKPALLRLSAKNKPVLLSKKTSKPLPLPKTTVALKKDLYAIQLASFAEQSNARLLVSRLRGQGYVASYNKFNGKQGDYYKVIVGQLKQRVEAVTLQKKLADNMQLSGFIIKTGVS